jgi:8-oxo-dGTP pyrophosphatase MutT (NUDIX family)
MSEVNDTDDNEEEFTQVINYKLFKQKAVYSYGIICFTIYNEEIFYILGQVRDTIPYKEFIRCFIPSKDMKKYILDMSLQEKEKLLTCKHIDLVNDTIFQTHSRVYKAALMVEEQFKLNIERYKDLLTDDTIGLKENPWIFPKGRKHGNETDLDTAKREFFEETQLSPITIYDVETIEETYYGLNNQLYKTIYFSAYISYDDYKKCKSKMTLNNSVLTKSLSDELTTVQLFNYEDAIKVLSKSKTYILRLVNNTLIFKLPRNKAQRRYSI